MAGGWPAHKTYLQFCLLPTVLSSVLSLGPRVILFPPRLSRHHFGQGALDGSGVLLESAPQRSLLEGSAMS